MGHPLIEEFCRQSSPELKTEFFRRCQRVFRDEVQPELDRLERLDAEHAALKASYEALQTKTEKRRGAA